MTNILIVDDNPSFRTQAARLCEREGFGTRDGGNVRIWRRCCHRGPDSC